MIIPSLGRATLPRALESLAAGSELPDTVTVVSNEVPGDLDRFGLRVRVLRFDSRHYGYGDRDVVLRRNIGIFSSRCSHVLTFDDDQVAPRHMTRSVFERLAREPVVWGHHRYARMDGCTVAELLDRPAAEGAPREHPPNAWHGWRSCYAGLFAARQGIVTGCGGFDMAFNGRHAGEDQALGRRLALRHGRTSRVFVHEPPFAWHPAEPVPWPPPARSNLCPSGAHDRYEERVGGVTLERCRRCPWQAPAGDEGLFGDSPGIPFDPGLVVVTEA